ncbi:MAG TPA: hypothetical protein VFZ34_08780 [Blastocatellia bacterium]|nr:hypothetical protein [Blastocatellia bacterium]
MISPNTFVLDSHLALHWTARVLSLLSIVIILSFFISEGFNPAHVSAGEWALLLCFPLSVMGGMLVAWRKEALGGAIAVGGLLGFYLVHAALAGGHLPRGWAYLLFASPSFLFLLSALLLRLTKR